jgi:hypothetical protein
MRSELIAHVRDECAKTTMTCTLNDIGCTWRGTRDTLDEHDNKSSSLHIRLLTKSLMDTKAELKATQATLSSLLTPAPSPVPSPSSLRPLTPSPSSPASLAPMFYSLKSLTLW